MSLAGHVRRRLVRLRERHAVYAGAAAVGAVTAWLRLRDLSSMEFGYDEALVLGIAQRVVDGDLTTVSNFSSVDARNPPLFPYLIALPGLIGDGPIAATAFVGVCSVLAAILTVLVAWPRLGAFAAITAGMLFAVAPWAVRFGRKLWSPDILPVVTVVLLLCLFLVLERDRTWAVGAVPVLLCACFQLHFSAVALAAPVVVVLAYRLRALHLGALVLGVVGAVLLFSPYMWHELQNGFFDLHRLAGEGGDGPTAWNWAGVSRAIDRTSQLVSAEDWRYMLGPDEVGFASDHRLVRIAGRAAGLGTVFALLAGTVLLSVRVTRRASPSGRWPFVALDVATAREALLVVWLIVVWLSFVSSAPARVFPHYLIVTYPISFLVIGILVRDVRDRVSRTRWRPLHVAVPAAVAAATLGLAGFTLASQSFVAANGGAAGDYGVAYRHIAALARFAASEQRPIDDVAFEATRQLFPHGTENVGRPIAVANTIRGEAVPACDGSSRRFGPLFACIADG